jgi:hypothetical protein
LRAPRRILPSIEQLIDFSLSLLLFLSQPTHKQTKRSGVCRAAGKESVKAEDFKSPLVDFKQVGGGLHKLLNPVETHKLESAAWSGFNA